MLLQNFKTSASTQNIHGGKRECYSLNVVTSFWDLTYGIKALYFEDEGRSSAETMLYVSSKPHDVTQYAIITIQSPNLASKQQHFTNQTVPPGFKL